MSLITNKVCAIIVCYNPNVKRLKENIESVFKQVIEIIIIDNNSSNISSIQSLIKNYNNVYIIKNEINVGISKALNQGFLWSNDRFDWVLTLDQDSVCSKNMIKSFFEFINNMKELKRIGMLCPVIQHNNLNRKVKIQREFIEVTKCITSGCLVKYDIWKAILGFDEWMFIDYVDFDFCIRLRDYGYNIYQIQSVVLNHELGDTNVIKLPFRFEIKIYNHNQIRNYYYVRNAIYYIRKHKKKIKILKEVLILVRWELIKIIFEKKRLGTLKSIVKGFKDGVKKTLNI